jgi:uncharacterized membrane protein YkoI
MLSSPRLLLVLAMLCVSPVPVADEAPSSAGAQDRAKVRPLAEILAHARGLVTGKVIDVELEFDVDDGKRNGRWVYEVEMITADNRVVELEFDALTGQLIEIEGAPWPGNVPRPAP